MKTCVINSKMFSTFTSYFFQKRKYTSFNNYLCSYIIHNKTELWFSTNVQHHIGIRLCNTRYTHSHFSVKKNKNRPLSAIYFYRTALRGILPTPLPFENQYRPYFPVLHTYIEAFEGRRFKIYNGNHHNFEFEHTGTYRPIYACVFLFMR